MKMKYIAVLNYAGLTKETTMDYVSQEYYVALVKMDGPSKAVFGKARVISDITDNIAEERTVKIAYNYLEERKL